MKKKKYVKFNINDFSEFIEAINQYNMKKRYTKTYKDSYMNIQILHEKPNKVIIVSIIHFKSNDCIEEMKELKGILE